MAKKGNQTPTTSFFIEFKKSKYKKAIEIYNKTKRKAQKWQEYLLQRMLAINKDGLWVHTKFGYSIPRRNGKNEVVAMRELYGLFEGEKILHTAHRTTTSHSAFERLSKLLDDLGLIEKKDYKATRQFGLEKIDLLETGGSISFRTRSSKGGLGEGFDLLIIDEAQEYTDDQESALKYVVTDSMNPQTLFCGTPPTPVSSGTVFTKFRENVLYSDTENSAWAEWSVEKMSDVRDRELWYLTNPSLGTIFTERSISDEVGSDEIDFNIQRLGLWIKYNQKSAISENDWEELKVDKVPALTGKLFAGIKYGNDGKNVALSIAVKTEDKRIFIETIDCQSVRNGNYWILEFLKKADIRKVVIDGAGGQNVLVSEMKDFGIKVKAILPKVSEIITANNRWEQGIFNKIIQHTGQPALTQVVVNCDKRNIGSNGGFGYKAQIEEHEIALMDSALLAHWICSETREIKKQKARY